MSVAEGLSASIENMSAAEGLGASSDTVCDIYIYICVHMHVNIRTYKHRGYERG